MKNWLKFNNLTFNGDSEKKIPNKLRFFFTKYKVYLLESSDIEAKKFNKLGVFCYKSVGIFFADYSKNRKKCRENLKKKF